MLLWVIWQMLKCNMCCVSSFKQALSKRPVLAFHQLDFYCYAQFRKELRGTAARLGWLQKFIMLLEVLMQGLLVQFISYNCHHYDPNV